MPETIDYSRIPGDVLNRWKTVRDVCAGDQRVRDGGYLPELNAHDRSDQNRERNKAYKQRAIFFGATGFTRDGMLGLAFRKDPQHTLPEKLQYLLKNSDGAGNSIYQQSQDVLSNIIEIGRHGLYVDYSEKMSRPIIKSYVAEDIINWRTDMVNGEIKLKLVVLHETIEEEDGYGYSIVDQYRELKLEDGIFICVIWRKDDQGKLYVYDAVTPLAARNNGRFDYIPFYFVGSRNNDSSIDPSPLYNMAQVNIGHYRNSADYEDSVFFAGQAQPWISGLTEEWRDHLENPKDANGKPMPDKAIYIGSRNPILLPENGAFGFAQVEPNTLVKEAMDQKEEQMIKIGARLIEDASVNKTATGEDNDKEATTSVLAMCVSNVSEAYQAAITACYDYLNITQAKDEGTYKINQDFVRIAADSNMITALVKAWMSGAFAKLDLRAYLRRIGIIDTERSDQEIDADLEEEGPALGGVN